MSYSGQIDGASEQLSMFSAVGNLASLNQPEAFNLGREALQNPFRDLDNLSGLSVQQMRLKRTFDVIGSIGILSLFSIPMLLIAIIIKLESKGSIFYSQERVGLDGRTFKMWKFRSMRVGAESKTGAVWAIRNDPRKTWFGSFLRSTSLDELPQLWNVFRGDMTLVGPRPERTIFVKEFCKTMNGYSKRHLVPVGITGWAQVHGWRGNTSLEHRLDYDLYYIRNYSLSMDIKTLFLTLFRGFINRNAY